MNKLTDFIIVVLLALILPACATMQNPNMTSSKLDLESKKFLTSPGKSTIYIIRPSKLGAKFADIYPTINKMVAGTLSSGSYLMMEVLPEKYSISVAGNIEKPESVEITAETGKQYFIKMYPKPKISIVAALSPGLHNEIINMEEGQELVLKTKRYKQIQYKPFQKDQLSTNENIIVYFIRPRTIRGIASNNKISPTINNKVVGTLERGTYLITKVAPGEKKFSAAGEFEGEKILSIEAIENNTYFIEITTKMGFAFPKLQLTELSQENGLSMITDFKKISEL